MFDFLPRLTVTRFLLYIEGILVPLSTLSMGVYPFKGSSIKITIPYSSELEVLKEFNRVRASIFRRTTTGKVVFVVDGMIGADIMVDYDRGVMVLSINTLHDLIPMFQVTPPGSVTNRLDMNTQQQSYVTGAMSTATEIRGPMGLFTESGKLLKDIFGGEDYFKENVEPALKSSALQKVLKALDPDNDLSSVDEVYSALVNMDSFTFGSEAEEGFSLRRYDKMFQKFLFLLIMVEPNALLYNGLEIFYFNYFVRNHRSVVIDKLADTLKNKAQGVLPFSMVQSHGVSSKDLIVRAIQSNYDSSQISWNNIVQLARGIGGGIVVINLYPVVRTGWDYLTVQGSPVFDPETSMTVVGVLSESGVVDPARSTESYTEKIPGTKVSQFEYVYPEHQMEPIFLPGNIFYPDEVGKSISSVQRSRVPTRYRVNTAEAVFAMANDAQSDSAKLHFVWDIILKLEDDTLSVDIQDIRDRNFIAGEGFSEYEKMNGPIVKNVQVAPELYQWASNHGDVDADILRESIKFEDGDGIVFKQGIIDFVENKLESTLDNDVNARRIALWLFHAVISVAEEHLQLLEGKKISKELVVTTGEKYPVNTAPVLILYSVSEVDYKGEKRFKLEASLGDILAHNISVSQDSQVRESFQIKELDLKNFFRFRKIRRKMAYALWGNEVRPVVKDILSDPSLLKSEYTCYYPFDAIKTVDELFEYAPDTGEVYLAQTEEALMFIKYSKDTADMTRNFMPLAQYMGTFFNLRKDAQYMDMGNFKWREVAGDPYMSGLYSDFADIDLLSRPTAYGMNLLQPVQDDPKLTPTYFLEKLRAYQNKMMYNGVNDRKENL